jgi:hypothetical protein
MLVRTDSATTIYCNEITSRGTTGLDELLSDNEEDNDDHDPVVDCGQIRVERPDLEPFLEDLVDRGNALSAAAEGLARQQCMQHLHNVIGFLKRLNAGWCTKWRLIC